MHAGNPPEKLIGGPDIKLVSEEQKEREAPSHKDERLNENEKEKSELIEEIAYLKGTIEELEKQLAEKKEQISELTQEDLKKTRV
jgi:hypothetical protein